MKGLRQLKFLALQNLLYHSLRYNIHSVHEFHVLILFYGEFQNED